LVRFIPIVGLAFRLGGRASTSPDGLVVLRQVFTSFVFALLMFGVVIAVLYSTSDPPGDPPHGVAAALLAAGTVGLLAGTRFERSKPLDCTDDTALANGYRARFFLRVAFADAVALFGFVGFFLTYDWWPYPTGLLIATFGFARAAPTAANLRREQERLAERGCFRSLVGSLRTVPPSRRGRFPL
jgi:hypothetical protein